MTTTEDRLAFAERFLSSPVPEAILYVPLGCIVIATNRAHARRGDLGPAFDGGSLDLVAHIELSKERLARSRAPLPNDICYCQRQHFVDVLKLADCSLAKLARLASRSENRIAKRPDYAFEKSNGKRTYKVLGVLGRWLAPDVLAVVPGDSFGRIRVWNSSDDYSRMRQLRANFQREPDVYTTDLRARQPYLHFLARLKAVEGDLMKRKVEQARSKLLRIEQDFPLDQYATREVVGEVLAQLDGKANIEAAKAKLVERGKSICDVYALEDVARKKGSEIGEWLDSVRPQHEFDVVFKPRKYVPGVSVLVGREPILDLLVLFGSRTATQLLQSSQSTKDDLAKLESAGMVERRGRGSREQYSITTQGFSTLRSSRQSPRGSKRPSTDRNRGAEAKLSAN